MKRGEHRDTPWNVKFYWLKTKNELLYPYASEAKVVMT